MCAEQPTIEFSLSVCADMPAAGFYSAFNAIIGSTFAARWAGTYAAMSAAQAKKIAELEKQVLLLLGWGLWHDNGLAGQVHT
jgi:hypothetical protein